MIVLQFLVSTAGIALLVALVRGLSSLFSDRGPRRRVEAIKAAHETVMALGAVDGVEVVARQRDCELAALERRLAREEARREWWTRTLAPVRRNLIPTAILSGGAALILLAIALFVPPLMNLLHNSGVKVEDLDVVTTPLVAIAAASAAATVSSLQALTARRQRRLHQRMLFRIDEAGRVQRVHDEPDHTSSPVR